MNLIIARKDFRSDGIFGELHDEHHKFICVTLEHAYLERDGNYFPKVAAGTYTCVRGTHQLEHMDHPFETFEITGVPPFDGKPVTKILFHWGNYNNDSKGCILLGQFIGPKSNGGKMITNSHKTFDAFMKMQEGLQTFDLIIEPTDST